ncbi:MAG: response regulator [Anaerolineaceae bacterium]|nr:response regulator [Anaerolineaceae bacterium]
MNMPLRALVIDDDPAVSELIRLFLRNEPIDIEIAGSGQAGIMKAKTTYPEIIFLDLMLPDMDGRQICEEIRKFSSAPIIIISALDDTNIIAQALNKGADDYITKPFSQNLFLAQIYKLTRWKLLAQISNSYG